jgi:hypothetical protein
MPAFISMALLFAPASLIILRLACACRSASQAAASCSAATLYAGKDDACGAHDCRPRHEMSRENSG